MKYCINCGAAIADQMKYCPECGAKQAAPLGTPSNVLEDEHAGVGAPAQPDVAAHQVTPPAPGMETPSVPPTAGNGHWQGTPSQMQPPYQQQLKPRSNGLAIAGFVVSLCLVLFVAVPVVGVVMALVSLGLSISGMMIANRNEGAIGMAVAGLVLSIIFGLTSVYYFFRFSFFTLF